MTMDEWLEYYERHTGCKDLELSPNETVLFHPDAGFVTFFAHNDILELHHLCGNGKGWQKVLVQVMKDNNLTKLRAFTRRNPAAWMRKYGGHVRGFYMEADISELEEA